MWQTNSLRSEFPQHPLAIKKPEKMYRIPLYEIQDTLCNVLLRLGFAAERAQTCARLFAEATCDGVYLHGLNRFPQFVSMIQRGHIDVRAVAKRVFFLGAMERWDGRKGPGNLNAYECMDRAIALSREHGIGCVSLRNTSHWMHGGTYGWQAAEAGFIGICWTNTLPNLPPWGGIEPCLGTNPMVFAVPRKRGHVVLDMSLSQFSYDALESYRTRGEKLPVDGGYDSSGRLTRDPGEIESSQRPLPIGYWKGAGLSMVLDMIAAMTSLGKATHQLDSKQEVGVSQVFMAINSSALGSEDTISRIAEDVVGNLKKCKVTQKDNPIRYPGEQTLRTRMENLKLGVPVEQEIWREILAM